MLVSYNYFSVGGLSNSSIDLLWLPGTIIFLGLAVSLAFSGKIQLLCLGDSMALSLGVKVKQVRMLCLVCASASAAAVVSFAGLLGFVGLMVPHISRKLAGTQTAPLLAVSAVHQHLIQTKKSTSVKIILESGEPREVHHFATLLGYGACAINPYMAQFGIKKLIQDGLLKKTIITQLWTIIITPYCTVS